ncbi:hypothetical protein RE428_26370 [Marinobacter nanhaiticus D15-8W]|uniref:DUF4892 domain-containing protein n=1 Tax=Marinobacter nanhaiticus D15-8W TaxID=626887 RepID=N6WTA1_9GAMM|nr:DUF4892 domain-containing protein [Marinobacter nanhaiticus]ENO14232.1 DUF4892 domain-containing protein [Marinobacter nanhaiticus D15-8W]BES71619.1 hypothetical protein RE428_26370 [Marinobacter nanhaiticus D15-8W]
MKMFKQVLLALAAAGAIVLPLASAAEELPAFPMATVEKRVKIDSASHRVLLSPVREVNDEIRADNQVRLNVKGTGRLMRIDPESSLERVSEFYREALARRESRTLFNCSGRDCGRSNVWANAIFDESKLYGRDDDQSYAAYSYRDDREQLQLVLMYTITRGNKRDYLWLEELTVEDESTVAALSPEAGRILGPVYVPWSGQLTYQFDWDLDTREKLVTWAESPGATVMIVSHVILESSETIDDALERSARVGDSMQALLVRLGIPKEQQMLVNAGPALTTVQDAHGSGNRLEIVVIKDIATEGS